MILETEIKESVIEDGSVSLSSKHNYKKSPVHVKEWNGVKIYMQPGVDEKSVMMGVFSGDSEDQLVVLGEFLIDVPFLQNYCISLFYDQAPNIEELRVQYESLKHFNKDLKLISDAVIYDAGKDERLALELSMEMIFVNKLTTISVYYDWMRKFEDRPGHQKLFKQRITSPSSEADKFGQVKGFGMKMTNRQFKVWKEFHDELFIIENIEEND